MKKFRFFIPLLMLSLIFALGCRRDAAAPSVQENVEQALEDAGFDNIDINEDRDNRVLRLTGNVETENQRQQVGDLARTQAQGWTIANEVGVRPEGEGMLGGTDAGRIASAEDDAIQSRFEAEATRLKLENVNVRVNEGVVTLEGEVRNQQQRQQAEQTARGIEGVRQVVNNIEIEGQQGRAAGERN